MSHSALPSWASHEGARTSCDVLKDWDLLLTALTDRLRSTVGSFANTPAAIDWQFLRGVVLECASDLDRLHVAWQAENLHQRKREADLHRFDDVAIHAIVDLNSSLHPANRA